MSNLEFLEISRNFKSYYRTLRDVHYYLTNDSELDQEEVPVVSKVLSKLIYGFIRIKGTSFREMDREQFQQEYNLFHQDFLDVIQNCGENNVDFDQFTALIDEIIGIAVKRTKTLGKIKKGRQLLLLEDEEFAEGTDVESQISNDAEENIDVDEIVDNEVKVKVKVIDEAAPEVVEVRTFSTDVGTLGNEVEVILFEIEGAEDEQQEPVIEVEVAEVTPKKGKNNYVDAAPVVNNYNDNESSEDFQFRPRRRKR